MSIQEEFAQKYAPGGDQPVQVWLYCRMCRCRIQVRTLPRADLPFRCFCGYAGTFAKFDVFSDEDEARKFATTFEDVYQTTKELLREAEMPLPTTARYSPEEVRRMKADLEDAAGAGPPDQILDSTEEVAPTRASEDAQAFRRATRELTDRIVKARDVLERHEALSALGTWAFARRGAFADARRVCFQACETDVQIALEVVKEATRRWKAGQPVKLKFPLFKRLVMLHVEDRNIEKALEVATRGQQLGLPGYEERVEMLRKKLAR